MADKAIVATPNAPAAIGPYSRPSRLAASSCFRQIVDPASGEVPGPIEAQARQVMENLRAILAAEGLEMSRVVKTRSPGEPGALRRERVTAALPPIPARVTVEVSP